MKKIAVLIAITCTTCFTIMSCKKKNSNPYSTWYINGQKFSTNNVVIDKGLGRIDFKTTFYNNGFSFSFDRWKPDGQLIMDCNNVGGITSICFGFVYNNKQYIPKNTGGMSQKTVTQGLTTFTLDKTYFFNITDSNLNDSILASGSFNAPYSN